VEDKAPIPSIAYIGLGANQGDRLAFLRKAIRKLRAGEIRIQKVSSLYETEPMEFEEQGWFYNAVIEVETTLSPHSLLERCRTIEQELGKKIETPKGPRTIDLDLLFYDQLMLETPDLTLPHPAAAIRPFVLIPLVEVAPGLVHPLLRRTASELLHQLRSEYQVEKRSEPGWETAGDNSPI
jgi:2-amino-4-hydroxy-6-hydroxymethyldihydropteridine diphosphokinase